MKKSEIVAMMLGAVLWLFLAYFVTTNDIRWQCQDTSGYLGQNGQACTLSINQENEGAFFLNILITENEISVSKGFQG